jgi:hypothetical protein
MASSTAAEKFPIEAAQQVVTAHQLGHGDTQAVEDAGEFTGDEAGADDHYAAGQLALQKEVIADPAQLGAGDGGALRSAAHGDQNALAHQLVAAVQWLPSWGLHLVSSSPGLGHPDRMGIDKPSPAADQADPRLGEQVPVQLVEPIDFGCHVGEQRAGIAAAGPHLPAIAGRVAEAVAKARSVDQQLLGHAAPDHAGAPDPIPLHDGHLGAVGGRPLGGRQATGAGAKHHQVKGLGHGSGRRGTGFGSTYVA